MASKSKSKSKSKLKRHQTEFVNKRIDLKRFAYDVFVDSASNFHLPSNCICRWEGPTNDYGTPEFLLAISRLVIKNQIMMRHSFYLAFEMFCQLNDIDSFGKVGELFQDVIKTSTGGLVPDIITETGVSLAVGCELIIFLYSKNSQLYVKDLAEYWFDCHFHLVKKKFEKAGGLSSMYVRGCVPKAVYLDALFVEYIALFCGSYEVSATIVNMGNHFHGTVVAFQKRLKELILKAGVEKEEEARHASLFAKQFLREILENPSLAKLDEASGRDPLQNPGLGIVPHEERLNIDEGSDATQSQNIPVESVRKSVRRRRESDRRGWRKPPPTSSTSVDDSERSIVDRPRKNMEKPNISAVNVGPPPRNLPEPSLQESARHRRLSGLQESRFSLCLSVKEGFDRFSLESSVSSMEESNISVGNEATEIQNPSGMKSAKDRVILSGQKSKSSSNPCLNVEQYFQQFSLGSSRMEQSSEEKSDRSVANKATQTPSEESLKESVKHKGGLSGQQKSKYSLCSNIEQGFEQLSLDSSGGKQSSGENQSVSFADHPTSVQELPIASSQEPAKEDGASDKKKRKKSKKK